MTGQGTVTKKEVGFVVLVLGVVGFAVMRGCDRRTDTKTESTVLAPGMVEKIIVNPDSHKLTVVTENHTQELFLPDRPSSIEISQKGIVTVTSRQFGTELKPFFGAAISNEFRLAAGIDGFYYKKLDIGLGVADKVGNYTPVVFIKVSYLVWSNAQMGLTFDNKQHIGVSLTVRI